MHKRATSTIGVANITSTAQVVYLTDIDADVGNANRNHNHIFLGKLRFRGILEWDQSNPNKVVRIIVCAIPPRDPPTGVGVTSNIYGRVDFNEIKHVYKDIRLVRRTGPATSGLQRTPVNFTINFRGLQLKYGSDDGESTNRRDVVVIFVGDNATGADDMTNTMWTQTWYE